MMGISRITAMTISTNHESMVVTVFGPCDLDNDPPNVKGKYGAAICWGDKHPHHPGMPVLSSNCVYDTAEEATKVMQGVMDELVERDEEMFAEVGEEMKRLEEEGKPA